MIDLFINPDLFRVINEYTDLRSLCDTGSLLSTLKKYINYKLNKEYSLMYYEDIAFRNIITSKIFNPYKQLHLNLNGFDDITSIRTENVHTLKLGGCVNITEVRTENVHTLNLGGCDNITEVRAENVHTIYLGSCKNIIDVSMLANVHTLDLRWCNKIIDVSA